MAITPCAGFVGGMAPIYIGAFAGAVCYLALGLKSLLRLDDSLDVIAVHLVGGLVGSILLGFFADGAINACRHQRGHLRRRQGSAAVGPDRRQRRHARLQLRRQLHHRQGARHDDGHPGRQCRRGRGSRPQPARRGGIA
ncbi:MAG: hypothetical protein WKF58_18160 [Ilumatobacteraceae bacterium]